MQTKDDGKRVILRVADRPKADPDHAGLLVMWLRHADGIMRRDGSNAASPQPHAAVDERGRVHVASGLSASARSRVARVLQRVLWRRPAHSLVQWRREDDGEEPRSGGTD